MPYFTWDDKYSIGNKEIDDQHKHIFNNLNRLYESSYDTQGSDTFHNVLAELCSYTKYHFKIEEQFMAEVEYNDIERHLSFHRYFTARLLDFTDREKNYNSELCRELILFLKNWLKRHVYEEDKQIVHNSKLSF